MQEKSTQNFTARIEAVKFAQRWSDEELATAVDISRRMLWLMKTGQKNITRKSWAKLEQLENKFRETPPLHTAKLHDASAPLRDQKYPMPEARALRVQETPPESAWPDFGALDELLEAEFKKMRAEINARLDSFEAKLKKKKPEG